jgi:antitoxin HicB
MKDARLRPRELGRRLNVGARVARQLVDLDYPSHIAQIDAALALLGKQLVVEVRDAA